MYLQIFWGDQLQQWEGCDATLWWGQVTKHQKSMHFVFQKSCQKLSLKFSMKLYTSLTHEDPTNLQITYHYVHYFKYTELKSFFQQQVWAPKLVYWLLNHPGYIYVS